MQTWCSSGVAPLYLLCTCAVHAVQWCKRERGRPQERPRAQALGNCTGHPSETPRKKSRLMRKPHPKHLNRIYTHTQPGPPKATPSGRALATPPLEYPSPPILGDRARPHCSRRHEVESGLARGELNRAAERQFFRRRQGSPWGEVGACIFDFTGLAGLPRVFRWVGKKVAAV